MATIVKGGALSHSPLIAAEPFERDKPKIAALSEAIAGLGRQILAEKPDVIVFIAQDHMRSLFYDLMPPMVIGTGKVSGWGDWKTREGPLPVDEPLARHVHRGLLAQDFDVACSYDLLVDHSIGQPLDMLGIPRSLPVIPVLINCGAPPLPSVRRCFDFGVALRSALQSFGEERRVAVVASGGLSHSPPMGDVEATEPEAQASVQNLIHGRASVLEKEAARQERLVSLVRSGAFLGSIDETWDERMLSTFASGGTRELACSNVQPSPLHGGGSGGEEVRTWVAACGVYEGRPAQRLFYLAIDSLITGMGVLALG